MVALRTYFVPLVVFLRHAQKSLSVTEQCGFQQQPNPRSDEPPLAPQGWCSRHATRERVPTFRGLANRRMSTTLAHCYRTGHTTLLSRLFGYGYLVECGYQQAQCPAWLV